VRLMATGALALAMGCVEFLPETDRALDASRPDVVAAETGARDVGADPPGCGGHGNGGQACCAGDRCNADYVCVRAATATCQRCGGNREPCCAGARCEGSRTCVAGAGTTTRCQ